MASGSKNEKSKKPKRPGGLKPGNSPSKSPAEILRQLRDDFIYYAPRVLKIRTKEGVLVPFVPNPMQKKILAAIEEQRRQGVPVRVVVPKARQVGVSTLAEGLIYHDMTMRELRNSLIVAHIEDASTNLFNMSKLFYDEMPSFLQPMRKASNAKELVFENPSNNPAIKKEDAGLRSKIKIDTARNLGAGRSETVNNLHVSEIAFWHNAEKVMTGLMQSVPHTPDSMVIVESTANGIGGYFYNLCMRARRGDSDFVLVFVAWWENPEYSLPFPSLAAKKAFKRGLTHEEKELQQLYNLSLEQLNWRRWCIENNLNGDETAFRQEYPSNLDEAFITSGSPVYNIDTVLATLQQLRAKEETNPPLRGVLEWEYIKDTEQINDSSIRFVPDPNGPLTIYEAPKPGYPYVIGGDTAEGGHDYSVGQVRNNVTWRQAATWRDRIDTDLYAKQMYCLGKLYNDALIGIETNFDLHPVKELERLRYPWQYLRQAVDSFARVYKQHGFRTDKVTRPVAIADHVSLARDNIDTFNDIATLEEMLTFVRNPQGRPEAQPGSYDDCIMADAICLAIRGQQTTRVTLPEAEEVQLPWALQSDDVFADKDTGIGSRLLLGGRRLSRKKKRQAGLMGVAGVGEQVAGLAGQAGLGNAAASDLLVRLDDSVTGEQGQGGVGGQAGAGQAVNPLEVISPAVPPPASPRTPLSPSTSPPPNKGTSKTRQRRVRNYIGW